MFRWSKGVATAHTTAPPAEPAAQDPAPVRAERTSDWRAHVAEAAVDLDVDGRIEGFTPGRQEALAILADDTGLFLIDRLRANERVVLLHAIARHRAGEERVEIDVTLRLDEAGRDWLPVTIALVHMDGRMLALLSERVEPTVEPADTSEREEEFAELAHEMRTPLNAVIGFGQALEAGLFGALGARQRDAVVNIVEASEHLVEVANAVLDAARLGGPDAAVERVEADVAPSVARSVAMVAGLADRHGVAIANRVTDRAGSLRHDPAALRQIAVNLLSNAIKASKAGGVVGVDARRMVVDGREGIELRVHDDGCGMDETELAALGRRFARGRSCAGEATGGLGLPLVRRLVERHGGTLRFASEVGHGTTASVFLPAGEAAKEGNVVGFVRPDTTEMVGELRCTA